MRRIDTIVIHQSDSAFGTAAVIDGWHREFGWSGIGYHRVILNGWVAAEQFRPECDGMIQAGRALEREGAHVRGHNAHSIGICLIGIGEGLPVASGASCSIGRDVSTSRSHAGTAARPAQDRADESTRPMYGYITAAQWGALVGLCQGLMREFGVAVERVLGHREFPGVTKTCPGFEVAELRKVLAARKQG